MSYITRQELTNGEWWTWINHEGLNTFIAITSEQINETRAAELRTAYLDAHLYDDTPKAAVDVYEFGEVLTNAVAYIKTENPTLNQWNSYLNTSPCNDALTVRFFLAVLARRLEERGEITLSDYTETQVLSALKTFIINTPARRLAKILFGE